MGVEFVGIELDLRGEEGVFNDLQKIDRLINSLGGKKKVDAGMNDLRRQLAAAKGELARFQRTYNKLSKLDTGRTSVSMVLDALPGKIEQARYRVRDLNQALLEIRTSARTAGDTFKQSFNKMSTSLTHIGQKAQTLGNTMQKIGSPFERFTTGIAMGAGYKAFNKFSEGLENGFERADIMRKYPRVMEAMGFSATEAKKSIDDLEQSVLGLPTGLDEMVSMAQRFVSTTGDIERGTDLAIATNNAFLASMATEAQRYQGMMQLQDVIGGKDMTAKEWNSLYSSMTGAVRLMGESLGYTGKELEDYAERVRTGKIANKDFLKTLIDAGADPTGKIRKVAEESMDTWEAFFSRIRTAASNLMYKGILEPLDEMVKTVTGGKFKSVNLLLDDFIYNGINNMRNAIAEWIKAHPEEIQQFFKDLSQLDIKSFAKGMAEGMMTMAKGMQTLAKMFGGKDLSGWGKWLTLMSPLGKLVTLFGGLSKGLSAPFAGIYAVLSTLNRIKGKGLMDALGEIFGGKGKTLTDAAGEATKAAPKMGKIGTALTNVFRGWSQIAAMVGGSALVAWGSMKLLKGSVKSFKEMVDILNTVDWDMGKKAMLGIAGFLGGMAVLGKVAGKFVGGSVEVLIGTTLVGIFTTITSAFAAIDMKLLASTAKSFSNVATYLKTGLETLNDIKGLKIKVGDIEGLISSMNEVSRAINGSSKLGIEGVEPIDKEKAIGIKNLAVALESIISSAKSMKEINKIKMPDTENLTTVLDGLGEVMLRVGGMFDFMPESLKSGKASTSAMNLQTTLGSVQLALKSLTAGDGILTQIPMITSAVQNINLDTVKTQFDKLGETVQTIYNSLNSGVGNGEFLATNFNNMREALKQVRLVIHHLNAIGSTEVNTAGTDNIKTIIRNLKKAFSLKEVGALSAQIQMFVNSIKNAMQALKEINEVIEVNATVKLSDSFQKSVDSTIKKIENGKDAIKNTKETITVKIPVKVTFSVSTNLLSALDTIRSHKAQISGASGTVGGGGGSTVDDATGGLIYRARGGNVPKRRGTDTVHAMLTPGEYVQNKRAVNMFGIDFMRKVNNLDVKGAMNELMTRAGSMANVGRQTVVNNYYNNNQRLTQNINTNNPQFAGKVASRFVGAF